MSLKRKIGIYNTITLEEIADYIKTELIDHKDIILLVKKLDEDAEDWDVTEKLYEYFKELHEEYLEELKVGLGG